MISKHYALAVMIVALAVPQYTAAAGQNFKQTFGFTLIDNAEGRVSVERVELGSMAAAAGLLAGDIIISADEEALVTHGDLEKYLNSKKAGESVILKVYRDKEPKTITLRVSPTAATHAGLTEPGEEAAMFGMFVIEDKHGKILVTKVTAQTPAAEAGIKKGDCILSVDDFQPSTLKDLADHMHKIAQTGAAGTEISIALIRGDKSETVQVILPQGHGRSSADAKPSKNSGTAVARILPVDPKQAPAANLFILFHDRGESTDVRVEGKGLPPGPYRLTIHEFGDCGDLDNESAGHVFPPAAPTKTGHQGDGPGDLGPLEVKEDGGLSEEISVEGLRLNGPNSIVGRAVILHDGRGASDPPAGSGVIGIANSRRDQSDSPPKHSPPKGSKNEKQQTRASTIQRQSQ